MSIDIPLMAWECAGLATCRVLVDQPGLLCRSCQQLTDDAAHDAASELSR